MGQSMIKTKLGSKYITTYVPSGHTEALAFAEAVMDGEHTVYSQISSLGSDIVNEAEDVNVMIEEDATKKKAYMSFLIKSTKHEGDVIAALVGKTFNGVKADKVVVIGIRTRQF